jgi:hypothetical protein
MEQNKVRARRRTRSQEAPIVDDRFRVETDDAEPPSPPHLVVGTAPLSLESVPPCLGQAVPSNELADPSRRSGIALSSHAGSDSAVPSAPSSAALSSAATPSASPAPRARRRGWLLLAPAVLLGVASLVLAFRVVLAPSRPAPSSAPVAAAMAGVGPAAANSPEPERAQAAPAKPEAKADPAVDDGFEIIEPSSAPPTRAMSSQKSQPTSRPRPASRNAGAPKPEPSSPVIF